MRNIKRALSLLLASVMVLGLMIVGTSAKVAADYPDAADIDPKYEEAIDVLSTIGYVAGDEDTGKFRPTDEISRAEAAKLVSYLCYGKENADNIPKNQSVFKDVAAGEWYAGYIAYCQGTGILAGDPDGNYRPKDYVTTVQFGKMLLVALHYDPKAEGYQDVGAAWATNVAIDLPGAGIDVTDLKLAENVTREQAAKMVLDTIEAPLVKYVQGDLEYETSTTANEQYISLDHLTNTGIAGRPATYLVEFGEKYIPGLEKDPDFDDFGRPGHTWVWKNNDIDFYPETAYKTYTTAVSGKDLYDLLGRSLVEDITRGSATLAVTIDGADDVRINPAVFNITSINRNNKASIGATGNGVKTEVFINDSRDEVIITITNTYLAQATNNYSSTRDSVNLKVYGIDKVNRYTEFIKNTSNATGKHEQTIEVSGEDFPVVKDFVKGDMFRVTIAKGAIETIVSEDNDIVSETTITAFKTNDNLEAEDTTYYYANAAEYDFEVLDNYTGVSGSINLKDRSYNLYLDEYGYVLGVNLAAGAPNYLFITGIDTSNSNITTGTATANAIFLDGTMKAISINLSKSDQIIASGAKPGGALVNKWFTFTESGGSYIVRNILDANGVNPADQIFPAGSTYSVAQFATQNVTDVGTNGASRANSVLENYKINPKNVSLPGRNPNVGTVSDYKRVYGNEDTVYLSVDVKAIKTKDNEPEIAGVINEVVDTQTGISKVKLETMNVTEARARANQNADPGVLVSTDYLSTTAFGTYTLYGDDGYIIACVAVAKNVESTTSGLVYVTSSTVTKERYLTADEEWVWSRTVVQDGVEKVIEEKGDMLNEISTTNMAQYNWYQVTYDKNGYVKSAVLAENALTSSGEYSRTIVGIEDSTKKVLYEASAAVGTTGDSRTANAYYDSTSKPYFVGGTFYVDTTDKKDFFVSNEAKIVFVQNVDGEVKVEYGVGREDLADFMNELILNGSGLYNYDVSALIDSTGATIVVVRDRNSTLNPGTRPTVPGEKISNVRLENNNGLLKATVDMVNGHGCSTWTLRFYMVNEYGNDYLIDTVNGTYINNNEVVITRASGIQQNGTYYVEFVTYYNGQVYSDTSNYLSCGY